MEMNNVVIPLSSDMRSLLFKLDDELMEQGEAISFEEAGRFLDSMSTIAITELSFGGDSTSPEDIVREVLGTDIIYEIKGNWRSDETLLELSKLIRASIETFKELIVKLNISTEFFVLETDRDTMLISIEKK